MKGTSHRHVCIYSGTWHVADEAGQSALERIKGSLATLGVQLAPDLRKPRLQGTPERPDIVCQLLMLQAEAFSRNASGVQLQDVTQRITPRMHGLLAYVGSLLQVCEQRYTKAAPSISPDPPSIR